jgi:hypothetical protein
LSLSYVMRSRAVFFAITLASCSAALQAQSTTPEASKASELVQSEAGTKDDTLALAKQLATVTEEGDVAVINDSQETIIPVVQGFNASLITTSQHDSNVGWSSVLTPSIAYRFNQYFSLSLETPVYAYIDVTQTDNITNKAGAVTGTSTALKSRRFLLGDTTLNGGFDSHKKWLDYNLTGTLGMPTGDNAKGLGAGQFTYAFINHFEHSLGNYVTPNLELGIDDSPNLISPTVHKTYTDTGTSAHFQFGFGISLPFNTYFETDAFEELPLAAQTVTSTTTNGKKGKQLKIITTTSQESIGEDNGFMNTLDIPLTKHVTLSGFYNRSLRNKIDTAGFSFTLQLRAPKGKLTVVE